MIGSYLIFNYGLSNPFRPVMKVKIQLERQAQLGFDEMGLEYNGLAMGRVRVANFALTTCDLSVSMTHSSLHYPRHCNE